MNCNSVAYIIRGTSVIAKSSTADQVTAYYEVQPSTARSSAVSGRLRYNDTDYNIINCVIFGCNFDTIDFGTGTTPHRYISTEIHWLGTDNTLANFPPLLGTVETIGYSAALNDTPSRPTVT